MSDRRVLDAPERRVEGRDKVTGRARYAADVRIEGALQVAFVRSPFAHASIRRVDVTKAKAMPGVRAVITGADTRPARLGRTLQDWPVLAWDRVRFIGDRVAAVAADTLAQAEAAAAVVQVAYEELPAVFTPDEALAPGAPVLHPDAAEYMFLRGTREAVPHPNVQGALVDEHGDHVAGFKAAKRIFEHEFEVARIFPGALEPRASVAWMEGDTVNLKSTNKSPFALRGQMASGLGIAAEKIVIDAGFIGGDFGGKGLSIDEYVLAFLARTTGKPVRTVTRYGDEMRATTTRSGGRIRLRTGIDADGRIVAHEARVVLNGGAYVAGYPNARLLPAESVMTLAGYHVPSARVESMTVYTNTVPAGNARAPGQPQSSFAGESHVDLIARALGEHPLDFRARNVIRPGQVDVRGHTWEHSMLPAVIEGLRTEAPPRTGRGYSIGARGSPGGVGRSTVIVSVTADARVEVYTSISDQGGGAHTMMQRVVATELGIPLERVVVRRGTTADTPTEAGIGGSRVTPVVGGAALAGARALRERLDVLAPGEPVPRQLELAKGAVRVEGTYEHPTGFHSTYGYAIDVEVDRETGQVRVTDAVLVVDVGTVINPVALRGQLVGGFVFGLGQALMEELLFQDGTLTNAGLGDYKLPTIADVPRVRVVLITDDKGGGPFGAKSVGELTNPAVGGAIANAIEDAVGARVRSLPLTAEKVRAALRTLRTTAA